MKLSIKYSKIENKQFHWQYTIQLDIQKIKSDYKSHV